MKDYIHKNYVDGLINLFCITEWHIVKGKIYYRSLENSASIQVLTIGFLEVWELRSLLKYLTWLVNVSCTRPWGNEGWRRGPYFEKPIILVG